MINCPLIFRLRYGGSGGVPGLGVLWASGSYRTGPVTAEIVMLAWLDRLIGATIDSLGGISVAVFGVGQLFVTSILVRMLFNHELPVRGRLLILTAFLSALGTSLMALGVWLICQAFRKQGFKL